MVLNLCETSQVRLHIHDFRHAHQRRPVVEFIQLFLDYQVLIGWRLGQRYCWSFWCSFRFSLNLMRMEVSRSLAASKRYRDWDAKESCRAFPASDSSRSSRMA